MVAFTDSDTKDESCIVGRLKCAHIITGEGERERRSWEMVKALNVIGGGG